MVSRRWLRPRPPTTSNIYTFIYIYILRENTPRVRRFVHPNGKSSHAIANTSTPIRPGAESRLLFLGVSRDRDWLGLAVPVHCRWPSLQCCLCRGALPGGSFLAALGDLRPRCDALERLLQPPPQSLAFHFWPPSTTEKKPASSAPPPQPK